MNLRFRFRILGGHVHIRVFGSLQFSDSMPKAGDLCFRVEEWESLRPMFERMGFECIDETAV